MDELGVVAFKNPDGKVVAVVMNVTDGDVSFAFRINNKVAKSHIEPHSIGTFIFED